MISFSFEFTWLLLILAAAVVFAIIDAVLRIRGRGTSVLAIIELIIAILLALSWFVDIPIGRFALAVALLVVLIVQLILNRARYGITIAAVVLTGLFVILAQGWIVIPGVN